MSLIERKKTLRTAYRTLRDSISPEERQQASLLASERFKKRFLEEAEGQFDRIFLFASCGSEISTEYLHHYAKQAGLTVMYPKVFGKEMKFLKIGSLNEMEKGTYGIMEPCEKPGDQWITPEHTTERDLMVVPGLLFDENLHRLGYGGGYYDRFLKGFKGTVCGIGFALQRCKETLPAEETDVPLMYYCCEDGCYDRCGAI